MPWAAAPLPIDRRLIHMHTYHSCIHPFPVDKSVLPPCLRIYCPRAPCPVCLALRWMHCQTTHPVFHQYIPTTVGAAILSAPANPLAHFRTALGMINHDQLWAPMRRSYTCSVAVAAAAAVNVNFRAFFIFYAKKVRP